MWQSQWKFRILALLVSVNFIIEKCLSGHHNMWCNLRYIIYVNVKQNHNNFLEITYNYIYICIYIYNGVDVLISMVIVKKIHPKPAYVFVEFFSKSSECFIATNWYIVIGTVKLLIQIRYIQSIGIAWVGFSIVSISFLFAWVKWHGCVCVIYVKLYVIYLKCFQRHCVLNS